jgi:hypothetical protein
VRGHVQPVAGRQRGDPQPLGDAAAAGDIDLQAVNSAGIE